MADRCPECSQLYPCAPLCTRLLEVRRFPDDSEEQRRVATALERANAGAAQSLLDRGINPHTYRAGGST